MVQVPFSITMDGDLKKQFDGVCHECGITPSAAISIFARAAVRQRRIPFEISAREEVITREDAMEAFLTLREQAKNNGVSDMTLDDINAEISLSRKET